jgi:hypothetical protein
METLKVKLESGAELEVWLASFQEGHALWMAVSKELKDTDFNEITVGRMSLDVLSSENIMRVIWPCMGKAVYTGHGYEKKKCEPGIFEKAEVRGDFLQIVEEVLVFNIIPFSKKIGSLLKTTFLSGIDTQKSK